MDHIAKFPNWN